MRNRAVLAGLLAVSIAVVAGGAWRARSVVPEFRVFGTRQPSAIGDTATLCAVTVKGARWALLTSTWHVHVDVEGRLRARRAYDAQRTCGPLLQLHGVATDTLPLQDDVWTLRFPAPSDRREAAT